MQLELGQICFKLLDAWSWAVHQNCTLCAARLLPVQKQIVHHPSFAVEQRCILWRCMRLRKGSNIPRDKPLYAQHLAHDAAQMWLSNGPQVTSAQCEIMRASYACVPMKELSNRFERVHIVYARCLVIRAVAVTHS